MYSSVGSGMHQLVPQSRLQFVTLKQDADSFLAHMRRQFPRHHFLGNQSHTPSRLALRRAYYGDNPLTRPVSSPRCFPGRGFSYSADSSPSASQRRAIAYSLWNHTHVAGQLRRLLSLIQLAQDRSTPQRARLPLPFSQHSGQTQTILLPQLYMHPMVALHVLTMPPILSP